MASSRFLLSVIVRHPGPAGFARSVTAAALRPASPAARSTGADRRGLRHRIEAAPAPRMTANEPPHRQPAAGNGTEPVDRFQPVGEHVGSNRHDPGKDRADEQPVGMDEGEDDEAEKRHQRSPLAARGFPAASRGRPRRPAAARVQPRQRHPDSRCRGPDAAGPPSPAADQHVVAAGAAELRQQLCRQRPQSATHAIADDGAAEFSRRRDADPNRRHVDSPPRRCP